MIRNLFLCSMLSLAACGPAEESADVEGCEHLEEGPATAVTATATSQDAPAVSDDHRRYDISLVDVAGGKGGNVKFASAEQGDFILFLGANVPVKVLDSNGGEVAIEESATSSATCDAIKGRHVVELGVGTYTFEFGPTPATLVQLVLEHGEHAHEE